MRCAGVIAAMLQNIWRGRGERALRAEDFVPPSLKELNKSEDELIEERAKQISESLLAMFGVGPGHPGTVIVNPEGPQKPN